MFTKHKVVKYILLIVLLKILGFSLFFYYSLQSIPPLKTEKKLKIHSVKTINEPIQTKLTKAELQEQSNNSQKWQLQRQMKKVHEACLLSYNSKVSKKENLESLKRALKKFTELNVFVANFYEKTYYGKNDYKDADARTIVLEEIQKVRRRGEGFIVSTLKDKGTIRYIYVKKLGFLNLYIGINSIK